MMNITIHRGTRQIGGSCVELECDGARIILDAGMPLDVNDAKAARDGLAVEGLFADGMDEKAVDALFISHAHQDHYGLLDQVRQDVPVYMSAGTAKLVEITRLFTGKQPLTHGITPIRWGEPVVVGPFTVTPHLVDHSAFDAHAFEIEAGGTLQGLVNTLQPKKLIPMHTEHPSKYEQFGVDVQRVKDGVDVTL